MTIVSRALPSGGLTFLFTDSEGSTKLLYGLGAERYAEALTEHRRKIRAVCARQDGVEAAGEPVRANDNLRALAIVLRERERIVD